MSRSRRLLCSRVSNTHCTSSRSGDADGQEEITTHEAKAGGVLGDTGRLGRDRLAKLEQSPDEPTPDSSMLLVQPEWWAENLPAITSVVIAC